LNVGFSFISLELINRRLPCIPCNDLEPQALSLAAEGCISLASWVASDPKGLNVRDAVSPSPAMGTHHPMDPSSPHSGTFVCVRPSPMRRGYRQPRSRWIDEPQHQHRDSERHRQVAGLAVRGGREARISLHPYPALSKGEWGHRGIGYPCCAVGATAEKLASELDEGMFVVITVGEFCYRKRQTKAGEMSRLEILVWRVQMGDASPPGAAVAARLDDAATPESRPRVRSLNLSPTRSPASLTYPRPRVASMAM